MGSFLGVDVNSSRESSNPATFVIPNSVYLSRRQTEILLSLDQRQGVPFCLNASGAISKPEIVVKKSLRIIPGILNISEDSLAITGNGILSFNYSTSAIAEIQILYFVKDSSSRDRCIESWSSQWGPILLPIGRNRSFDSSEYTIQDRMPASRLPFYVNQGTVFAGLYDIAIVATSPTEESNLSTQQTISTNRIDNEDSNMAIQTSNISADTRDTGRQSQYFFARFSYPSNEEELAESHPTEEELPFIPSLSTSSRSLEAGSDKVFKGKVVLHRFKLASSSGIFSDIGGVYLAGSNTSEGNNAHEGEISQSTRSFHSEREAGQDIAHRREAVAATPSAEEAEGLREGTRAQTDCVVCMTAPCDVINYPCRHSCLCLSCASSIASDGYTHRDVKCPICRVAIKLFLRIATS